jgi:hypothetical protein
VRRRRAMGENANRLIECRADKVLSDIRNHKTGGPPKSIMPKERMEALEALVHRLVLMAHRPNGRGDALGVAEQREETAAWQTEYEPFLYASQKDWMTFKTNKELDRLVYACIALAYPKASESRRCPRCGHWLSFWECGEREGEEKCGFAWVLETIPDGLKEKICSRDDDWPSEYRTLSDPPLRTYGGRGSGGSSPCGEF